MGREHAWGAAIGAGVGTGAGLVAGGGKIGTAALGGAGFPAGMKAGDLASMSTVDAILYNMETTDINLGDLVKKSFEEKFAANGANTYGNEPLRYRTEPELVRTALTGVSQIVGDYLISDLNE